MMFFNVLIFLKIYLLILWGREYIIVFSFYLIIIKECVVFLGESGLEFSVFYDCFYWFFNVKLIYVNCEIKGKI